MKLITVNKIRIKSLENRMFVAIEKLWTIDT